jgi:hypothetical protein
MDKLIPFLRGLEEIGRHFMLGYYTVPGMSPAAITVHVTATAAERWEVEFFEDGSVEIERFASAGGVEDTDADIEALLAELRADA